MANEDKTITIKFRGDTVQFNNSVSNIDKMIKVLRKDTKDIEKQLKLDPSNPDSYARAISNVAEQLALAEGQARHYDEEIQKYTSLSRTLTDSEVDGLNTAIRKRAEYGRQVVNFTEQLKRLQHEYANLDKLQIAKNLDDFGKKTGQLAKGINQIADATKYVSLVAGAALTGSASAAITFEEAMANVAKVLRDEDAVYFDELRQSILDMSRVIPVAAKDIAQVAANALQLGVRAKDVEKFTEVILKLGTATDIATDEAAITLAQFFNVTGEDLQNIDKFGAALVELGNRYATGEAKIMEMAQRLSSAASIVGFSSQDILAFSTALASTGLNAESAGSAISTILRNLDKEVATNGKHLSAWAEAAGMSVDEFKKAWVSDSAGTFQMIVNGIDNAVDGGENLNLIMQDLGINAIRQSDAFGRLVNANEVLNTALYDSSNAWREVAEGEDGALNEEFAKRASTVAALIRYLKNDIEYLGITLGDLLLPYVRKFVGWIRQLVDWFIKLSPQAKSTIAGILIGLTTLYPVLKTIGTVLKLISGAATGIATIIKNKIFANVFKSTMDIAGALEYVADIWKVIKGFGITALILGLIARYNNLLKTNEAFRAKINLLVYDLKESLMSIAQRLFGVFTDFSTWFTSTFQPLMDYLKQLYHEFIEPALANLFTDITSLIFKAIVVLFDWLVKIIEWLIAGAKPVIETTIILIKAIATFLAPIIHLIITILDWIIKLIAKIGGGLAPIITALIDKLGAWNEWLSLVISTIEQGLLLALQTLLDVVKDVYTWFKDGSAIQFFKDALNGVKTVVDNVKNGIADLIDKLLYAIGLKEELNAEEARANAKKVTSLSIGSINTTANVTSTSSQPAQAVANASVEAINRKLGKMLTNF